MQTKNIIAKRLCHWENQNSKPRWVLFSNPAVDRRPGSSICINPVNGESRNYQQETYETEWK